MHTTSRSLFIILLLAAANNVLGASAEWNTGPGDWNIPINWFSNDVPDNGAGLTFDVQIGNRPLANGAGVTFVPEDGTSDTITSLIMSNGADLYTNGNQLNVASQTTLTGLGSTILIEPHNTPGIPAFQTVDLDIDSGGVLVMIGGIVTASGLTEINGSLLQGRGQINLGDLDITVEQAFENSGEIQVNGTPSVPGTLTLHANGVDTIDLDGDSETGVVQVSNAVADLELDWQTLIVDGPLSDAFGGTLQIGQRDTITFNDNFSMSGATISLSGGNATATLNGPADITSIANSSFTISGASVMGNDMAFSGTANTITLNAGSFLTLPGTVTIPDASALIFLGSPTLIISGNTSITEAAGDFDWDGGSASVVTTIKGTGILQLNVDQVDVGSDVFNGTINLNENGDLSVQVTALSWTMAGTLNKNNAGISSVTGDSINVTGGVNVNAGTLDVDAALSLGSGANFTVAGGAVADLGMTTLGAGSNVTVNGTMTLGLFGVLDGPATLGGAGLFRLNSNSAVPSSTTVNTTSFDWDGTSNDDGHTIAPGATFTINSTVWDADDATPGMDDNIQLTGNAKLIVNGVPSWTMNRTLTTNVSGIGAATIGGTARLILSSALGVMNVQNHTLVQAPITFGSASTTNIAFGTVLSATSETAYSGATITGGGTFSPNNIASGALNTVNSSSTIETSSFNFDGGNWLIKAGAELTINVSDAEPDAGDDFNSVITLAGGNIDINTGADEFIMDGAVIFDGSHNASSYWLGEPLDIGNDSGNLNADVFVTGPSLAAIFAAVDFNSDADVEIAAGGQLLLGFVTFDTVNGANHAEFTGAGAMMFSGAIQVNEAVTLNMVGGTVDLDGLDNVGDFINIDAPMTINVAAIDSFGKSNASGVNTLDIDHNVGTGLLTVNLDAPGAEWTLNPQGVINLVNDNAQAVLLAGSAVNLNGPVHVTGNVQIDARVDIGGTVHINTAGQPLRLNGGSLPINPNTLAGGTINGPGLLNATSGHGLHGFGTINANIDFDGGGSALRADDGTLNINGSILDVGVIGTADTDGILNVVNPWNTNITNSVTLQGGQLTGGTITNGGTGGLIGRGLISSRVINNQHIEVIATGHLILQTPLNDNDWDGSTNTGTLVAGNFGTLEVRDTAPFDFLGTVNAAFNGTVFTSGFELRFQSGSTLTLTDGGHYKSSHKVLLHGNIIVAAGADSTIETAPNELLQFKATSVTVLNGNLWLMTTNGQIETGATFAGDGVLGIPLNGHLAPAAGANMNVAVNNHGLLSVGGNLSLGLNDFDAYQQAATGVMSLDIAGINPNQFDRLVVDGSVQLAGALNTRIEPGFVPSLGQVFDVISATGGISGTFDIVSKPVGIANDRKLEVSYSANAVQLTVVADTYWPWVTSFPDLALMPPEALTKGADPDGDGVLNIGEFALDSDPSKGNATGKMVAKIAPVGGINRFTLTFPVRAGAIPAASDPAGGTLVLEQTIDDISYSIQSSDDLSAWTLDVSEVTGDDAAAIQAGLPPVSAGWVYRTFASPGPVAGDPEEFMRVVIANTE